MRSFVLLSLTSLLAVTATSAAAQQAGPAPKSGIPVVPGARVRITAQTLVTPLIANFLEQKGDTAVFIENAAGRGIWTFTVDQITKLEQSAGEKKMNRRQIVTAAAIGAPAGALLFWGVTGVIKADSGSQFKRGLTAGAGFIVGAGIGALIGTRYATEHWMALPLPKRVSILPRKRGGVDVGMGFSF